MSNRFETLMAPPSLGSKELAIHLRMHPEIPKEVSGACRSELLNVQTRVHDELSTVRFERDDIAEPPEYRGLCRQLTGSKADPIPFRFFAAPYSETNEALLGLISVEDIVAEICEFVDPWQVQAWAAQALRIGTNAEIDEPDSAPQAWTVALWLYEEFFGRSKVDESYAYRFVHDENGKAVCLNAWESFLSDEFVALRVRADEYSARQQSDSLLCAMAILGLPEARPYVSGIVVDDPVAIFVLGIRSADSLAQARQFASQLPASLRDGDDRGTLTRSLLRVMTAEAEKVADGFGDVDLICACVEDLGEHLNFEQASGLHRAALADFFEACAQVALTTIARDLDHDARRQAAELLQVVPADWLVGREMTSKEEIHRDAAAEVLLMPVDGVNLQKHLGDLMKAPVGSQAEEDALTATIAFVGEHPILAAGPMTTEAIHDALTTIFANSVRLALGSGNPRGSRMAATIAEFFPAEMRAEVDGRSDTLTAHLRGIEDGTGTGTSNEMTFLRLAGCLAEEPLGSEAEADAVSALIRFARDNPEFFDGRQEDEAITQLLVMTFVSAARVCQIRTEAPMSIRVMREIAGYLPERTELEVGEVSSTLEGHLSRIEKRSAGQDSRNSMSKTDVAFAQMKAGEASKGRKRRRGKNSRFTAKGAFVIIGVFLILLFGLGLYIGMPTVIWIWTGNIGWDLPIKLGALALYYAVVIMLGRRFVRKVMEDGQP